MDAEANVCPALVIIAAACINVTMRYMNKHEAIDHVNTLDVARRFRVKHREVLRNAILHETNDQGRRFIFSDGYLQRKTGSMR